VSYTQQVQLDDFSYFFARYDIVAETGNANVPPPESWSEENAREWLFTQVTDILNIPSIKMEVDLFEQGMDR
jgi:hypothetical protein